MAVLLLAAAVGVSVFAVFVRQATRVEYAEPSEARLRFQAVLDTLQGRKDPLIRWESDGGLQRNPLPSTAVDAPRATELRLLAYRAGEERLTELEVPLWFLRLKEPVVRPMLKEAGLDWSRLRLDAGELQRAGPGLVLHEEDAEGNALIVWLE